MTDVTVAMAGIFAALDRLGRDVAATRAPGLSEAAVADAVTALGLDLPPQLAALYGWADGLEGPDEATIDAVLLFPGYYWLSLAGAVETYRAVSQDGEWDRAWLPVFASGGADFYGVICDRTLPDFGAVLGFLRGEPGHLVEFRDLAAMMAVVDASYRDGAFFVENGYLKADYPRMRAIAAALQPGFEEHAPG